VVETWYLESRGFPDSRIGKNDAIDHGNVVTVGTPGPASPKELALARLEKSSASPLEGSREPMTVVIGENLIDLLVRGDGATTAVPGGGPFNVARTIGRLGQAVTLFSGLSHDAFGVLLRNVLEKDHVRLAFEKLSDLPTALAVVDTSGSSPRYSFHLHETAAFGITAFDGVETYRTVSSPTALYVGTLGLVVESMATMSEQVVEAAAPSTLVILDPNCRPSATPDYEAYRSRITRLLQRSDIVKASTEDLEFLFPGKDHADSASALLKGGATTVIVTDGANAIRAYNEANVSTVDVPVAEIEDTVGAGDALVGGLLAWWAARRLTREDAHKLSLVTEGLQVAVRIASFTCSRKGAEPPWSSELVNGARWYE
jgi:fructokinase